MEQLKLQDKAQKDFTRPSCQADAEPFISVAKMQDFLQANRKEGILSRRCSRFLEKMGGKKIQEEKNCLLPLPLALRKELLKGCYFFPLKILQIFVFRIQLKEET